MIWVLATYLNEKAGQLQRRSLLSVRGLLIKINKGTIISWLLGFVVMGAMVLFMVTCKCS